MIRSTIVGIIHTKHLRDNTISTIGLDCNIIKLIQSRAYLEYYTGTYIYKLLPNKLKKFVYVIGSLKSNLNPDISL